MVTHNKENISRILVLDAQNKNSLACVKSLGREGYFIGCASPNHFALSFWSRYVNKRHILPKSRSEEFLDELIRIIKRTHYDVLIPVSLESYVQTSLHKSELESIVKLFIPEWDKMEIVSNKDKTFKLAKKISISSPLTIPITTHEDIENAFRSIGYPIVLKASESGFDSLRYCNNLTELEASYKYFLIKKKTGIIAQEYIRGASYGFYGLFSGGIPFALFMHKRIKEFPITGGASAVASSYYDEELKQLGLKIMHELKWTGPAMVEFKKDAKDGKYKLIEINPKLWGSLDLTISAGIDIPSMIVKHCMGAKIESKFTYKIPLTYRWIVPDELLTFFAGYWIKMEYEKPVFWNLDIKDPLSTIVQFLRLSTKLVYLVFTGNLRYPSGRVKNEK